MKKFIKLALLCLLSLYCLNVYALDSISCINEQTTYEPDDTKICRVDQIIINDQGVFLLIDGFWLGSQGLQAVTGGFLVLEDENWIALEDAVKCQNYYVWQCMKCRYWNPQGVSRCLRCNKSR